MKSVDKYSIYSEIEYINSENFIFYSNIYDNVSIYDENCDKALVNSILNELEISTIDKEVKDDNLSLGQKQRLNLAKVFYNRKNIVILDEATSNLDEKNRYNIENKLINSDKTLILITHHYDDEYLKQFDKVIYLKKGEVVQYEGE
ncbi:ATP-binding cassette domain-containing protein [uncultured Sneathia sp.]|uniref:ATP-binding cassette domain-containing protein n=1 Tax=uncultured Sneathia sp. TaxID=278067 RepID=UPI00338D51AE